MPEQKTPSKEVPIASITHTRRFVFPARPLVGAGRYKGEEPAADITIIKAERGSKLTPEQLAGMGSPGGQRVSNVKEMLAFLQTEKDKLSDRIRDDSGRPVDKGCIADSILFVRDYPQGAKFEAPGREARLEAMLLYCGGNLNRIFLLTNAPLTCICDINSAFCHQITAARSIKLSGPGGAEWYLFLAPGEVDNTMMAVRRQFPEASPAPAGEDVLKLFVADSASQSGADLPAVSPKSGEDQYGFALPAPGAQQPVSIQQPAPGTGEAFARKPEAQGGFFRAFRGARTERNTIQGIGLEDLGYAEKVPGSDRKEALRMRGGSAHKFSGFEVQLKTQDGSRKFMFSNTPPEILADHGATGYLMSSDYMKIALADGRVVYIIEVCEDTSTLKLTSSPREDECAATGQVPLFENPYEAVRWVARKAASLAEGRVAKEIILSGSIIALVAAPEDSFFIITNGSVEDATSGIARVFETPEERMLITIDICGSNCVEVGLLSGETMKVKVVPVSMHMSRKPELGLPTSPSMLPAPGTPQTAPYGTELPNTSLQFGSSTQSPAVVSPSAAGSTEESVLVSLDVGIPTSREGVAALLRDAIMPTPASVLDGGEGAKSAFGRKRRFLTSIAQGVGYVTEHNDGADPLVFTAIRTRVGDQDFSFNLYRLRSGIDELSPALRDMRQSFVFTDSERWYILLPPVLVGLETRKLLLESTMTR